MSNHCQTRSLSLHSPQRGFISVGANGQGAICFKDRASVFLCKVMVFTFGLISGIVSAVRRSLNLTTWRVDSSLRSHRPQRSLCRCAYSGLNKSLFASVGPNSHGRDHRQDSSPGRINPSRGHRLDGTPNLQSLADIPGVAEIPPQIIHIESSHLLSAFGFFGSGLIGSGQMIGPLAGLIESPVSHHGVDDPQQSSSHSHIGFGFANSLDQPLPDGFLAGIGLTEGYGSLAQSPTQDGRAGLGDIAGLCSSGRFFQIGSQSGPELQGISIGESIEGSDFGGNDTAPDLGDARNALQDGYLGREVLTAIGGDDLSPQSLTLAFSQDDDVGEIGEGLLLYILEQVSACQQPSLCRSSVQLGTANVGGQEHRPDVLLGSGEGSAQLSPVSSQLPQLHQGFISDESQGTISSNQPAGDIQGVVSVGLSSLSSAIGQFGSVGDIDTIDTTAIAVDEPLYKTHGLDSHPGRSRQSLEPVLDFIDTFGAGGDFGNDLSLGIDSRQGDSTLVQVNADEGSETGSFLFTNTGFVRSFVHNKNLRVRGQRKLKHTWKSNRFHRPLHAFTLIELLVVVAIIALLVSILVPSLQNARRITKLVVCKSNLHQYALGLSIYANMNSGRFPPHDEGPWGGLNKIWSSEGEIYPEHFPDKQASLEMYRDVICGGTFKILMCPFTPWPGSAEAWGRGGTLEQREDPDWPLLVYDGRFGENYMAFSYMRLANAGAGWPWAPLDWSQSGNSITDGPPIMAGGANDAILADPVGSSPGGYSNRHAEGNGASFEDRVRVAQRADNNVAYGDGHAETHHHRNAYIDAGDYINWDGAHWVVRAGFVRLMY